MATVTKKLNHAKRKREVARILANAFKVSGVTYECPASFYSTMRDCALQLAKIALNDGYMFSKSAYFFALAGGTADIFLTAGHELVKNEKINFPK